MKKMMVVLSLIILFIISGCAFKQDPVLKGFYQSEQDVNGYFVQISIQKEENSFVEYIDNREVDRGTFEEVENDQYIMSGEMQNFEISLNEDNSFDIIVNKLNDGNPIKMVKLGDVPAYFLAMFDDVEEYKDLLGD